MFKLNSGDQDQARHEEINAQQSWADVTTQFGAKPQVPYEKDAAWAASRVEVNNI